MASDSLDAKSCTYVYICGFGLFAREKCSKNNRNNRLTSIVCICFLYWKRSNGWTWYSQKSWATTSAIIIIMKQHGVRTFGTFGSLDSAKKTLSKMCLSTISCFSPRYKSIASVRHPKNNQTFGNCSMKKRLHIFISIERHGKTGKLFQQTICWVKWHVSVMTYLCILVLFFQIVPVLPESSIWCDSRARANQNNRLCWIFGQMETWCAVFGREKKTIQTMSIFVRFREFQMKS